MRTLPTLAAFALAAACVTASAQVGLSRLDVGGLPVTLVYPTAQRATPQSFGPFTIEVAPDAAPAAGVGALVVLSHGTGGSPMADHDLAATLARAGFVVAQPMHAGDNHADTSGAGPDAWATRPREVSAVIDALARHPLWSTRLRLDRVGVHGMSAGGVTALALAGGQWRTLDLVRHCLAHADDDPGFCFNGLADPKAQGERRERYERARGVPEFLLPWPVREVRGGPDPRVAAVTVAVPVVAPFSRESLARIRVPVGVIEAGRDTMLLPRFHSERLLRECGSCERLARLDGAAHMDLLAPWPAELAARQAQREARGGAPEPGFDPSARRAAFERVAAFFTRQLAGP
jgi:predicted dienelactone hydrolase